MNKKMNESLNFLREKYGAAPGEIEAGEYGFRLVLPTGKTVELLPRRVERRFVELKKIIDGKTLEDVSTFRFARFEAGGALERILAEELDLAAFLSGSRIVGLFASGDGKSVCNVIFRLENGMSGCVECGVNLPAGSEREDRHEVIARRGVASDRAVDTQVPQSSIYCRTAAGVKTYTDVDTELFGLDNDRIWEVRAAFAVLSRPESAEEWNAAFDRGRIAAAAALKSACDGIAAKF